MATLDKETESRARISDLCAKINTKLHAYGIEFTEPHIKWEKSLGFGDQYTRYYDSTISVNPECIGKISTFYMHVNRAESGYPNEPQARQTSIMDVETFLARRTVQHILSKNGINTHSLYAAFGPDNLTFSASLKHHICCFVSEVCTCPEDEAISSSMLVGMTGANELSKIGKHFSDFMTNKTAANGLIGFRDIIGSELTDDEKAQISILGAALGSTKLDNTITSLVSSPKSVSDLLNSVKDITWEQVNFTLAEAFYEDRVLRRARTGL